MDPEPWLSIWLAEPYPPGWPFIEPELSLPMALDDPVWPFIEPELWVPETEDWDPEPYDPCEFVEFDIPLPVELEPCVLIDPLDEVCEGVVLELPAV